MAVLALGSVACASRDRIPPPAAPAPAFAQPSDAIPADLDVALRIDLSRIRAVLGESAFEVLRHASNGSGANDDRQSEALMAEALQRADAVWIAFRPGKSTADIDSVTILRGHFAKLDPRKFATRPAWGPSSDLGGGWRRYDRARPKARGAPARIYARTDELLVFVSTAPLDSVERRLEAGVADPHLEPVEKGVISLDARPRPLARLLGDRSPTLARLLLQAERLRLTAGLEPDGLDAELELALGGASEAREVAASLGALAQAAAGAQGLTAKVLEGLQVEAVANRVVVRLRLPPQTLAAVIACAQSGTCG
ncbi:MAG: hypothetical protein IPI67_18180 [Myxococcales bacterium]|nr:hypothetical protein [Myxococcales bacterium]